MEVTRWTPLSICVVIAFLLTLHILQGRAGRRLTGYSPKMIDSQPHRRNFRSIFHTQISGDHWTAKADPAEVLQFLLPPRSRKRDDPLSRDVDRLRHGLAGLADGQRRRRRGVVFLGGKYVGCRVITIARWQGKVVGNWRCAFNRERGGGGRWGGRFLFLFSRESGGQERSGGVVIGGASFGRRRSR